MFSCVCFQMDLKLLLIFTLLGAFCYSNAQKGKTSQSHLILLNKIDLYTALLEHHYSVTWCQFVDVILHSKRTIPNGDYLRRERGRLLYLNDVIDQRSTFALRSVEDNGKDRIFCLCFRLPSNHSVPHDLMCKHGGLNRLPTLQGLCYTPAPTDSASSSLLSLFSI